MSPKIEALESRTLFAATIITLEVQALHTEEAVVKTDIAAWKAEAKGSDKIILGDLKRLGVLKIDKALLKTAGDHGVESFKFLSKDVSRDFGILNSDMNAMVGAEARSAKKPGTLKLEQTARTDFENASSALFSAVNAIEGDAEFRVSSLTPDLTAIANANSGDQALQADIATVKSELTTREQGLISQSAILNTDGETILGNYAP